MSTPPLARHVKKWACRRCGRLLDQYEAFGYGSVERPKYCCLLTCIPWWVRLKMRLRNDR